VKLCKPSGNRAVALILAVVIMAVLAVIGFSYATSMKLGAAAGTAIKSHTQARLAARAAMELYLAEMVDDAVAAGPLSDYEAEALFAFASTEQTLMEWGDWTVVAEPFSLVDESRKMNLNAFGNIVNWNYQDALSDNDAISITDPDAPLYHATVDPRLSSFEVSFEEFFYYQRAALWSGETDEVCRIRSANFARAVCLFRYNADGKPGIAGNDDDDDNAIVAYDGIDNDGDGVVDEDDNPADGTPDEGFDEPDEFVPDGPHGDDTPFATIDEFKTAIAQAYSGAGWVGPDVPAAVNYTAEVAPDQDQLDQEAQRILNLVKGHLTVYSYNLGIRSASIDHPGQDGYDNDGDGLVDQSDTIGAATYTELIDRLILGETVNGTYNTDTGVIENRVDINEKQFTATAQAVYLYLKLKGVVTGLTLKNCLDIVDYRDTDGIPIHIRVDDDEGTNRDDIEVANLNIAKDTDYYGMEGLHITEVGRFIEPSSYTLAVGPVGTTAWTGTGPCTLSILSGGRPLNERQADITVSDTGGTKELRGGGYLMKLIVSGPSGATITFTDSEGGNPKVCNTDGSEIEFFYGPLITDSGTNSGIFKVEASNHEGDFSVDVEAFYLPYVEVMNMSRRARLMTDLEAQINDYTAISITSGDIIGAADAHTNVPGFDRLAADFKEGYQFFVIAYDEESFERHFEPTGRVPADATGSWGINDGTTQAEEDFAIAVLPDLFADGLDGNQYVKLLDRVGADLVAGSIIDGFSEEEGGGEPPPPPPDDIVVDNLDAEFSTTGTWAESNVSDEWAGSSFYCWPSPGGTATWTPALTVAGTYKVYAWWANHAGASDRDSDAEYTVTYAGGAQDTSAVDQDNNGGQWNLLGTYAFDASGTENVTLLSDLSDPAGRPTSADAVKFEWAGEGGSGDPGGGIGACKPFSATTIAASRLICGGDLSYAEDGYKIRPELDGGSAPTTSPGRWNHNDGRYNEAGDTSPGLFWPTDFAVDGSPDLAVLSDAGYYRSPGEVARVSSARLWAHTFSCCLDNNGSGSQGLNNGSKQPLFKELLAYVVAGRSPARVNINTASDAVLSAALLDADPGLATILTMRPFTDPEWLCHDPSADDDPHDLKDLYYGNSQDDDDDNATDDYSEREEWYVRYGNIFTLRGHAFTTEVQGTVKNASGQTVAWYGYEAICDRSRKLDGSGDPLATANLPKATEQ